MNKNLILPDLVGAENGYNQRSDVLVQTSVDGIDYNKVWKEFQETLRIHNAERTAIVNFLTFPVTSATEAVTQLSGGRFERATEYFEPRGQRQSAQSFWLGYSLEDYDAGIRYTYQFLSRSTAGQIEANHASIIAADNELVFTQTMSALYNNSNRVADINNQPVNVYALYNGDGTVPPKYKTNTFDGTHNHYLVSGATTVDPTDLDDLIEHLRHHGYTHTNGVQLAILVNSREGKTIRQFRISGGASYDFIPSQSEATALILEPGQSVSGGRPASSYRGLNVIGSYGEALIIEDDNFPAGYIVIVGSGGSMSLNNPVGIREHDNPSQRGLRLVKGADNDYPLTDSFYLRSFGTGVRQRGGAAVMQIKASGAYQAPVSYV